MSRHQEYLQHCGYIDREVIQRIKQENQCDGCRRGLELDDWYLHRTEDGHVYMACTKDRYE